MQREPTARERSQVAMKPITPLAALMEVKENAIHRKIDIQNTIPPTFTVPTWMEYKEAKVPPPL